MAERKIVSWESEPLRKRLTKCIDFLLVYKLIGQNQAFQLRKEITKRPSKWKSKRLLCLDGKSVCNPINKPVGFCTGCSG